MRLPVANASTSKNQHDMQSGGPPFETVNPRDTVYRQIDKPYKEYWSSIVDWQKYGQPKPYMGVQKTVVRGCRAPASVSGKSLPQGRPCNPRQSQGWTSGGKSVRSEPLLSHRFSRTAPLRRREMLARVPPAPIAAQSPQPLIPHRRTFPPARHPHTWNLEDFRYMLRLVLGKIKSGSEKMFVHVNKYDRPVLRCSPFLLHAFVQTGEQHRIVDLRSPAFWRSLTRLAGVDAGERVFVENVVLRFVLVDPECEQFPTGCKVFNGWNVCWGQ